MRGVLLGSSSNEKLPYGLAFSVGFIVTAEAGRQYGVKLFERLSIWREKGDSHHTRLATRDPALVKAAQPKCTAEHYPPQASNHMPTLGSLKEYYDQYEYFCRLWVRSQETRYVMSVACET